MKTNKWRDLRDIMLRDPERRMRYEEALARLKEGISLDEVDDQEAEDVEYPEMDDQS